VGNQRTVQNQRCPAGSRFARNPTLGLPAQHPIGGIEFRFLTFSFEAESLTLSVAGASQTL